MTTARMLDLNLYHVTDDDNNVTALTEQEFKDKYRIVGHDNDLEVEEI